MGQAVESDRALHPGLVLVNGKSKRDGYSGGEDVTDGVEGMERLGDRQGVKGDSWTERMTPMSGAG